MILADVKALEKREFGLGHYSCVCPLERCCSDEQLSIFRMALNMAVWVLLLLLHKRAESLLHPPSRLPKVSPKVQSDWDSKNLVKLYRPSQTNTRRRIQLPCRCKTYQGSLQKVSKKKKRRRSASSLCADCCLVIAST